MGGYNKELDFIVSMLNAGLDPMSAIQMYQSAQSEHEAEVDERKVARQSVLGSLGDIATQGASAGMTGDQVLNQISAQEKFSGVDLGRKQEMNLVRGVEDLYRNGIHETSQFAPPLWGPEDAGALQENLTTFLSSNPNFARDRKAARDFFRVQAMGLYEPDEWEQIKDQFHKDFDTAFAMSAGQAETGLLKAESEGTDTSQFGLDPDQFQKSITGDDFYPGAVVGGHNLNPGVIPSQTMTAPVKSITDGDTVVLGKGIGPTRIAGLNTPEIGTPGSSEATDYLTNLLLGQNVQVGFAPDQSDPYGRTLGYLWQGGNMVNENIISEGLAPTFPFPSNNQYTGAFAQAVPPSPSPSPSPYGALGQTMPMRPFPDPFQIYPSAYKY